MGHKRVGDGADRLMKHKENDCRGSQNPDLSTFLVLLNFDEAPRSGNQGVFFSWLLSFVSFSMGFFFGNGQVEPGQYHH